MTTFSDHELSRSMISEHRHTLAGQEQLLTHVAALDGHGRRPPALQRVRVALNRRMPSAARLARAFGHHDAETTAAAIGTIPSPSSLLTATRSDLGAVPGVRGSGLS